MRAKTWRSCVPSFVARPAGPSALLSRKEQGQLYTEAAESANRIKLPYRNRPMGSRRLHVLALRGGRCGR